LGGQLWIFIEEGEKRKMISRIWRGWTTPGNAEKHEALRKEEIFVGIQSRQIHGLKSIQLLRCEIGEEVEFVTIMLFDSLDAVREFAGEDEVGRAETTASEAEIEYRLGEDYFREQNECDEVRQGRERLTASASRLFIAQLP
jgi:heme-degrading monooxygenase HmoA